MMETWISLSLLTVILCGVSGIISKIVLRSVPSSSLMMASFLIIMPTSIFLLIAYIWKVGLEGIDATYVLLGLATAFMANLGFFLYFDALERGPITIVGSVTAAYPVIIIVLAILLLGETLTLLQGAGVTGILFGVVALTYIHGLSGEKTACPRVAIALSIMAFLCWGAWGVMLKTALESLDVVLYIGLSCLVMPFLTFAYLRQKGENLFSFGEFRYLFKASAASIPAVLAIISIEAEQLGFFSETFAVSTGPASLVFPVVASYPVVTIVLAFFLLHERISMKEYLLIALVLAGIIIISAV
ncbi:MAG TPA: DMT family transporter [Euryarchaeota archaeon]|nr:DMT family transporter [Euryarchaeota archaeon]